MPEDMVNFLHGVPLLIFFHFLIFLENIGHIHQSCLADAVLMNAN